MCDFEGKIELLSLQQKKMMGEEKLFSCSTYIDKWRRFFYSVLREPIHSNSF